MLRSKKYLSLGLAAFASLAISASAGAAPHVVTSIKPLHSLVASVMQGLGTPDLIISGQGSPHTYSMKPSDAESLQQADVIFWIGADLENFLAKPIDSLGGNAKVVSLMEQSELQKLPLREGSGFGPDDHGESGETYHAEHDAHIWLDPDNAKLMLETISRTLGQVDAANATTYQKNAMAAMADIDRLDAKLKAELAPVRGLGFIVFHDAYHYFENHYGLAASGAISINPENPPGAAGIAALQAKLRQDKISCVFAEPQFDNKLVTLITEGTETKSATLDPLGVNLASGPAMYGALLQQLANAFVDCASP